jgi:hypothetical protein
MRRLGVFLQALVPLTRSSSPRRRRVVMVVTVVLLVALVANLATGLGLGGDRARRADAEPRLP